MPTKRYCAYCDTEHDCRTLDEGPQSWYDDFDVDPASSTVLFRRKDGYHYFQDLELERALPEWGLTDGQKQYVRLQLNLFLYKVLFVFPFEVHSSAPGYGSHMTCAQARHLRRHDEGDKHGS